MLFHLADTCLLYILCPNRGRKVLENRQINDEERISTLEKELEDTIYHGEEADHKYEEVTACDVLNLAMFRIMQSCMPASLTAPVLSTVSRGLYYENHGHSHMASYYGLSKKKVTRLKIVLFLW